MSSEPVHAKASGASPPPRCRHTATANAGIMVVSRDSDDSETIKSDGENHRQGGHAARMRGEKPCGQEGDVWWQPL